MANDWSEVMLGELVQNFDSKRVPLSGRERAQRRGRYPYYGATGIMDYVDNFLFDGLYLLVAEDGSVERPDGKPFLQLVDGKFWVNNHAHVLRAETDQDTRFIYYALSTIAIRPYMSGSVQAKLSQSNLNKIVVTWPTDECCRHAISHILGALDDKIELNRRMNETLEAMARALFKSWFVDVDPVRAKAEGRDSGLPKPLADLFPTDFDDTKLSMTPKGWSVIPVGDQMLNFDSRRVPVSGAERAKRHGPYPYHGAAGVMDYIDEYLFDGIYLLVGEDGSVIQENGTAVIQYAWGKFWVNNHAHVLQGKASVSTEQLLLYFQFEPLGPYVTGAVQPKLSQGRMNTMPFLYAGEEICEAFGGIVGPWFEKYRANVEENRVLAALRNSMVPKLVSGDLQVKDADRIIQSVHNAH